MQEPRIQGYQLESKIGEGGMGVVYRARQTPSGEQVAVKLLPLDLADDRDAQGLFLREAILTSTLDHTAIARLVGSGEAEDGRYYFASELLRGRTLQEVLQRETPSLRTAVGIAAQVAAGLEAAHAKGVIHRDVKPSNLMLVEDGARVKILDFGLATLDLVCGRNSSGSVVGSVNYSSPEQLRGEETGPSSDLWSLGVVLYEMLAGLVPFRGGDHRQTVEAVLHRPPDPIVDHRPEVPAALAAILEGMLAKEPGERPASAADLREALEALAAELPVAAEPVDDADESRPRPSFFSRLRERLKSD